jgi:hypothetical protein
LTLPSKTINYIQFIQFDIRKQKGILNGKEKAGEKGTRERSDRAREKSP